MKIFKSEEDEQGFKNLRADYDLICSISGQLVTNLATNNVDALVDFIEGAIYDRLTEEFIEAAEAASAGNLDEMIEFVDATKKELEANG